MRNLEEEEEERRAYKVARLPFCMLATKPIAPPRRHAHDEPTRKPITSLSSSVKQRSQTHTASKSGWRIGDKQLSWLMVLPDERSALKALSMVW